MWNGIGWYGFIGPTISTTDISLTTSADDIFRCFFFLGALRVKLQLLLYHFTNFNQTSQKMIPGRPSTNTAKMNVIKSLYTNGFSELILGCGSVIIMLFWQYWPQISIRKMPRFGAIPVILCVIFVFLFAFRYLNSIPFV